MPPCQADFHGDSVDLTWQVLLDAVVSDEGSFLLPRRQGRILGLQKRTSRAQKAVKAVQGRVRKCRRARQISAETALTAHNLTEQVLLDGKLIDEGAFPSPRGRDVLSAPKRHSKSPKGSQGRPAKGPKVPPCQADSLL